MTLFFFPHQDKLYQDEYQLVVSEEEMAQITGKLREASEWMDEDGYSATTKELREKLSQLRSLCKDMFFRVEERRKWPERLAALESMLNTSSFFLRSAEGRVERWGRVVEVWWWWCQPGADPFSCLSLKECQTDSRR